MNAEVAHPYAPPARRDNELWLEEVEDEMEIALLSGVAVVDMEDAVVVLLDLLLLLIFDGWFPSKKKKINGGGAQHFIRSWQ